MEIKNPQQLCALKHNDFVALMPQADVGLFRMQPAVFFFGPLHLAVELVQEPVAQELVVGKVELPAGVPETVVVALAGEIKPFRVAELVAFEVEVAFAAEAVGEEAEHFVEGEAAFNDRGENREDRHIGVDFFVAEPH